MKNERVAAPAVSGSSASAAAARASTSTAVPIAARPTDLSSCVSFSAPTQRTTSCAPHATACQPRWKAVAAEAHAFSTLKIGIASMPTGRRSTWPRIISWPVTRPATAFPTYAACMSPAVADASASACVTASATSSFRVRLDFSNRVIPTPAT